MIYQTINFADFRNAFRSHNRMDQFSYEGARILFDWLEQITEETGEDLELDVIALCCDFAEMTEQEVREYYYVDHYESVEDYLQDNTIICGSYTNDNDETVFVFQYF